MYTASDTARESEDRANNRYNWRAFITSQCMINIYKIHCVYCLLDERIADDTGNDMKGWWSLYSPSNVIFIGTGSARVKLLLSRRVTNAYT